MSWSKPGSSGLVDVSAIFLNEDDENRINYRQPEFKLVSATGKNVVYCMGNYGLHDRTGRNFATVITVIQMQKLMQESFHDMN